MYLLPGYFHGFVVYCACAWKTAQQKHQLLSSGEVKNPDQIKVVVIEKHCTVRVYRSQQRQATMTARPFKTTRHLRSRQRVKPPEINFIRKISRNVKEGRGGFSIEANAGQCPPSSVLTISISRKDDEKRFLYSPIDCSRAWSVLCLRACMACTYVRSSACAVDWHHHLCQTARLRSIGSRANVY